MDEDAVFCSQCGSKIPSGAVEETQELVEVGSLDNEAKDGERVVRKKIIKRIIKTTETPTYEPVEDKNNIFAILALVFSFVFTPAGLILGFVGLGTAKKCGGEGKGMSVAAIIISAVQIVVSLVGPILAAIVSLVTGVGAIISAVVAVLQFVAEFLPFITELLPYFESAMLFV